MNIEKTHKVSSEEFYNFILHSFLKDVDEKSGQDDYRVEFLEEDLSYFH